MEDQNHENEIGAANNNADDVNVVEENQAGDDIWDQIFDQNFVADPNAYDYEAHHQVLLQNLQAGHHMFIHHNGFPMPEQIVVQPEAVAQGSSSQPSGSNDAQAASDFLPDVQNLMATSGNDNPAESSVGQNMEGWGYVNEAYQTDSSSLSEFVASSESQQEVLTITREQSPTAGCFLEIPDELVRGINVQAFRRRFEDSSENDQPNPPNTPVSVRSDLNISSSALNCSPSLPTSPGACLRSAIEALSNISEDNKNIFDSDGKDRYKDDDLTKTKNVVEPTTSSTTKETEEKATSSTSKETEEKVTSSTSKKTEEKVTSSTSKETEGKAIGKTSKDTERKATSSATKIQIKRKYRDDHNEESIQISLSRPSERPDYLFVKFGSFMVILVLLFPLAIIACLQGLLPEKYANSFLILLILSFLGACYFFIKACYVKNDEPSDTTTTSTVKYGTIQNPKPGTSTEPA